MRRWCLGLAALLGVALPVASCDMPVRVGVEHLRAQRNAFPTAVAATPKPAEAPAAPAVAPAVPPVPRILVQSQPAPPTPPPAAAVSSAPAPAPAPRATVVLAPLLAAASRPGDLQAVRLDAVGTPTRGVVSFGQVFAPGAVPSGSSIVAVGPAGPVPTQADIKSRHPDGSARMVVITVRAAAPVALMLRREPVSAADAPRGTAPAGELDLTVVITVRDPAPDREHRIELGPHLARAPMAGASVWLNGPLVVERRIEVPVTGSLRLVADVRQHADGVVRTDLQFNNDIALEAEGGPLTYDVVVTAHGRTVLRRAGLRHHQYQTWHQEIWSDTAQEPHVVHDTRALARAGAVPDYDTDRGVEASVIARLAASLSGPEFDILGSAGLARYMPTTGGRGEIGITTFANAAWLVSHHPDAKRYALAQADAAGSVPWHYYDRQHGSAVSPGRHPRLWVDYRAGQWGTKALTQAPGGESGWTPDNAHQPDLSYVAFVLTGSRYRYDQLQAQALYSILAQNPGYRGDDKGIVVNTVEQVRGRAWAFRAVEQAAFIAPDDAPLRDFLRAAVGHCIAYLQAEARWRTIGEAYGAFADGAPGNWAGGTTGTWQQDFFAATLGMAARRQVPGAADLVTWMSNFVAGRFTSGDKGFRPGNGTAFYLAIAPENGREPYLTWREIEAVNIARKAARDDDQLAYADVWLMRAARGTLAIMSAVTPRPQVRAALTWVEQNMPGDLTMSLRRDPAWNIRAAPSAP